MAVPSPENQDLAVQSILTAMENQVILLSAFDDEWKTPGPLNVEQFWVPASVSQTNPKGLLD
jgi:exo-beta-1,3-glucanase (GH17 family)